MFDVREQLGGYGEQLDSLMTPVEFEEVVADRARPEPVRPVRLRKPLDGRLDWQRRWSCWFSSAALLCSLSWVEASKSRQ